MIGDPGHKLERKDKLDVITKLKEFLKFYFAKAGLSS
jgi:hypothetical protein